MLAQPVPAKPPQIRAGWHNGALKFHSALFVARSSDQCKVLRRVLCSASWCTAAYGPRGFVRARYEIYVSARGVDIAGSPFVVFAADGSAGAVPQPPVLFALPRCRGGPAHLLRTRTSAHTNAQLIAAVGWYATVVQRLQC